MVPRPKTSDPHRRRRIIQATQLAGFFAAVVIYYLFVVSAGNWTSWRTWSGYYDTQAEGFRAGHLYVELPVSPALRALPDPLNPKHARLWRWDYSFYGGHFHLYWGLAPAALLAAVKTLLRIHRPVTDDVLVFVFLIGRALGGCLLIRAMARRLVPGPPAWAVWTAMAVFALAHPTPYLLARGAIYEAAITAGAAFTVAALYLAFEAIFAADERAGARWAMLASLSVGLGAAARVSLLPAGAALVGLLIFARWRAGGGGWRRLMRVGWRIAAPFGGLTLVQLLLNRLRYGAWGEFGQRYQMGFQWFAMGPRFVAANLYIYLFRPLTHLCTFPFLFAKWGRPDDLFPRWLPVAADYRVSEPSVGVMLVIPFAWLSAGLFLARWLRRTAPPPFHAEDLSRWRLSVFTLVIVTAMCAGPIFLPGAATMRYEGDFASGLLLIATLGAFHLLALPGGVVARIGIRVIFVLLAASAIAAGVLLGFTGYFDHFAKHNPTLLRSLVKALSLCH